MRLQEDALASYVAPGADKPIARLDKIDRALELRPPGAFRDPGLGFIYLDKTPWGEDGIHCEVFCSDVAIGVSALGKRRKIFKWHHTPPLDHPCEVRGLKNRNPRV